MMRLIQRLLLAAFVCGAATALGFSLLGPQEAWQVARIGYNSLNTDIGGPHNLGEEFRWNIRKITYGYDESFVNYFGSEGVAAVERAIQIMNDLPAMSQTSTNLEEFPTDSKRINFQASALNLLDLKSMALGILIEEMGLASPERYAWTLRDRRTLTVNGFLTTNYLVIQRNFDPVTLNPTPYVNGVLYTYQINDPIQILGGAVFAEAQESVVDPSAIGFTSVANTIGTLGINNTLGLGEFFIGLTRDDVGGLRYLWRTNNFQIESLVAGTILTPTFITNPPPAGSPVGTAPTIITNPVVNQTLRPGVDKIVFVQGHYDSIYGAWDTITNTYTDMFVTNSLIVTQSVRRILTQPDILFSAEDIGLDAGGNPLAIRRTTTAGWVNNNAINGQAALAGPGVIPPQVIITFNKVGPFFYNANPFFIDEANSFPGFVWGSFDGTTNPPVVFPSGISIQDLENQVLNGP